MVDQWQPNYERGAGRSEERAEAIDEDMLTSARRIREPINSRGDILNAFDSITYQKGATVIGMFEGWIGEEPFRRGVRSYLESRRDGNATVDDFLGALGTASKRPVAPAFATFLDQNGVPQVEVKLQCGAGGAKLALSQRRLTPLGRDGCLRSALADSGVRALRTRDDDAAIVHAARRRSRRHSRCREAARRSCSPTPAGAATMCASYHAGLLARLAADRNALSPSEYASLLYDMRALVRAGSLSGAQALEWVRAAGRSRDRHVVDSGHRACDDLSGTRYR